jgi:DNA replication protein DnaC
MKTYPCRDCGKSTGIERVENRAANSLASMLRCDECESQMVTADEKREADRLDDQHRRRVSEMMPKELRLMRFSTSPAPRAAVKAANEWARAGGQLILIGDVGRGKTGLAAAAVWTRLYWKPITWTSVPTFLANLTAAYGDEERAKATAALRAKTALALDDIDKFKPSEWAASQLFAAIDNALTRGTDLIVTSNKTPGQLADFIGGDIGAAIGSRLAGCRVVKVTGPDHRLAIDIPPSINQASAA